MKLTWSGNSLLEGALELTFPSGDESAPKRRSGDLALTNGTKSFRLLVPASSQNAVVFSREVRAQFVTKAGVLDLGRFDFGARPGTERAFSICVSKAPLGGAAKDATLWQSVRLDRFRPEDATYKAMPSTTLPVFVDTEEMPATALGYTRDRKSVV